MKKIFSRSIALIMFLSSITVFSQIKPIKNTVIVPKTGTVLVNPKLNTKPRGIEMCSSVPLPNKVTNPECTGCELGVSVEPLTVQTAKMWQTGSTLRVRMDGGTVKLRLKVAQYASEWTRYTNIRFRFVTSGDAEIIVTFGNDGRSWSYIGTDCIDDGIRFVGNFQQQGTTHFGWLTDDTPEEEFSRVILHEFGHALGFKHEHSHPESGIPWDRERVYEAFANSDGWNRSEVDRNVFEASSKNETQFSQYDPTSIMQYPVAEELTIGDFSVGWNTQLSETDKAFAKLMYPRGTISGNKLAITILTGADDLRVNSAAQLYLKFRSGAVTNATISLNKGQGWGNNSRNTVLVPIPDGITMVDIVECKLAFTAGKQFEWDNPDNWNVNEIVLDYVASDGARTNLATRNGIPYVRYYATGETLLFRR